ncbi:hypothetical protein QBC46DRAFT_393276 [Diplogelasinospora grovesii]|uniref:Uncharacterized protein n=1 Tax=Diplogelasinospora grovesii TaxID=303347 RepID=A0AAN6S1L9_9PEZI|nr:hypothetical protein QBC46DRAFT_393276 [Diplogelasinospora grovesii]
MKWQTTLIFASIGSTIGSTIGSPVLVPVPVPVDVYTLRLSSKAQSLNGQYLSVRNGNNETVVGVFPNAAVPVPALQVYAVANRDTGGIELHRYYLTPPGDDVDHALALVGSPQAQGLMTFSDVKDPATAAGALPQGTTCDWTSFVIAEAPDNNSEGSKQPCLGYAAGNGRWVAFPSGNNDDDGDEEWSVMWKESSAITIQNYMTVDILFEPVYNKAQATTTTTTGNA